MNAPTPALEEVQRAVGPRYTVEGLAGAGGMGAVYRARHRELGHVVAIKVLPPEVAHSTIRQARFKREAALAARLSHPHIVPVYEFETRDGLSYLIMPFVAGRTLEAALEERRRLTPGEVLRVAQEIGAALDFAHARGVVHRDVKPSNILIEEGTGRAVLTDFGVAQADPAQGEGGSLTAPGAPIGTPDYMAPEQVGADAVDGRADLYALAVVAFEALTGTLPAAHVERSTLARALAAAQSGVSRALAGALVAPLAAAPADRPATAELWLQAVHRARRTGRRTAVAVGVTALAAATLGGRALCHAGIVCRPPPAGRAIAVMPFAVIGASPFSSSTQLAEVFVSRFAPVDEYDGVLSLGRVLARSGPRAIGQSEADTIARELGARYFVLGDASFRADTVQLTARLYEVGRRAPRGTAAVTAALGATSDALDRTWGQLLGSSFAPSRYGTLPQGKDALVAYLDAERAFRAGDYAGAAAAYDRVIALDSAFSLARFRRALVIAQVDPTGDSLAAALQGALRHQSGLSPADSLMLDGYAQLLGRGDGAAALARFRAATRAAPDQPLAWFVLGEFHAHFGALYGQNTDSALDAFNRALDLVPQYAPAIAHLIPFAYERGDRVETRRLMDQYRRQDSTSVVAQVIGIADTLVFGSPAAKVAAVSREGAGALERRPFEVLAFLATQAAAFGTDADRQGPGRRVLRALQARAATPAQRQRALRMAVAADLRYGWLDSARARLAAAPPDAQSERDRWLLLARAAGLPALGDAAAAAGAASRLATPSSGSATDPVPHWLLALAGPDAVRPAHAARLRALAAGGAPLATSLSLDIEARRRLAAGDTAGARTQWESAAGRYEVLSVPSGLIASLWPIRLARLRLAAAERDSAALEALCGTFDGLIGYTDQAAAPEVSRRCASRRAVSPPPPPPPESAGAGFR